MGERRYEVCHRFTWIIAEEASAVVDVPHHRTLVVGAYKDILSLGEKPVVCMVALQVEYIFHDCRYVVLLIRAHKWNLVGCEVHESLQQGSLQLSHLAHVQLVNPLLQFDEIHLVANLSQDHPQFDNLF